MIEPMASIRPLGFTVNPRPRLPCKACVSSLGCFFDLCTIPAGTRTKGYAILQLRIQSPCQEGKGNKARSGKNRTTTSTLLYCTKEASSAITMGTVAAYTGKKLTTPVSLIKPVFKLMRRSTMKTMFHTMSTLDQFPLTGDQDKKNNERRMRRRRGG